LAEVRESAAPGLAGQKGVAPAAAVRLLASLLVLALCALLPTGIAAAAQSRPDRALYQEAQRLLATVNASPQRQRKRAEWEKVVMAYRR
jgi:hypothetical protein